MATPPQVLAEPAHLLVHRLARQSQAERMAYGLSLRSSSALGWRTFAP